MANPNKELTQVFIEKVVNTRQAYTNPDVPLTGLPLLNKWESVKKNRMASSFGEFYDEVDKGKNFLKNRNWQDGIY